MTLTFPQASELAAQRKSESASGSFDFTRACFAVSVTASDIPSSTTNGDCNVPVGIFYGFVAPGESVSLTVPNGKARKLEVFSYTRTNSSDPCPTGKTGLQDLELSRLARVGLVSSFEVTPPEVSVNVTLEAPTSTLVTQYSLPATCQPPATEPAHPRAPTAGLASGGKQNLSTSRGYLGEVSVGHTTSEIQATTARGYQGYFSVQGVSVPK